MECAVGRRNGPRYHLIGLLTSIHSFWVAMVKDNVLDYPRVAFEPTEVQIDIHRFVRASVHYKQH